MVAASPPSGIFVPVPTFFASKSSSNYNATVTPLDVSTQSQHAVYLAKNGIKGLVILGSTGEAVHITNKERFELLSGVRKQLESAGFPDYPIMAGTATQSIEETVVQLQEAKEAGAQWGMCLAPGYFASAVSQEGLVEWFTAVADRSPLPVLVYHYPAVSNNVAIAPSTMEQLAQHPNIVGCKLSHGNLDDLALVALSPGIDHDKFRTYTGLGQVLLPVLTLGGAGAIDGLASMFPKTVVRLFSLWEQGSLGKLEEMRALQHKIAAGEKLVAKWGVIGVKEGVSRLRGFGEHDGGRTPLRGGFPAGDAEWAKWEGAMAELEAVERSL
ncbi:aldolase [Saccharata proteae CBS 121410]|uniref:Aldolase n=1 Tax=Saccharata proteae CBS 121410 TaxID=1314787 RepID=A0A9P4I0H7_9PEZI|nr:aldolase [Saccharata proteae CBS 121410]